MTISVAAERVQPDNIKQDLPERADHKVSKPGQMLSNNRNGYMLTSAAAFLFQIIQKFFRYLVEQVFPYLVMDEEFINLKVLSKESVNPDI